MSRRAPALAWLLPVFLAACGKSGPDSADDSPQMCLSAAGSVLPRSLPPPPRRTGIGETAFTVSSKVPEAAEFVRQGVALLHGFWEFEAYRAFQHAANLDPSCAMAYWGSVLCQPGREPEFPNARQADLASMRRLSPLATPVERAYITAVEHLLASGPVAYADALLALWETHPNQIDAAAWAAYHHLDGHRPDGRPTPRQQRGLQLIHHLLTIAPDHPGVLHYAIHLHEVGPDPSQALPWARRLAQLAPNASHLVHMEGHVAYFMGNFAGARTAFLRALAIDEAYLASAAIPPFDHKNHAHNLHFLALACIESGHIEEAFLHARRLRQQIPPLQRPRAELSALHQLEAATLEARLHLRLGNAAAAAADLQAQLDSHPPDSQRAYLTAFQRFAIILEKRVTEPDTARAALADLTAAVANLNHLADQEPLTGHRFYLQRAARQASLLEKGARALTASDVAAAGIYLSEWKEQTYGTERMDPPLLPLTPTLLTEWITHR